jgi:outer membrane murein-binding lipoprotein Lpp
MWRNFILTSIGGVVVAGVVAICGKFDTVIVDDIRYGDTITNLSAGIDGLKNDVKELKSDVKAANEKLDNCVTKQELWRSKPGAAMMTTNEGAIP